MPKPLSVTTPRYSTASHIQASRVVSNLRISAGNNRPIQKRTEPTPAPGAGGLPPLLVGTEYLSHWFQVNQSHVDAFAAATGDDQSLHKPDAQSRKSPFGGPIAPGLYLVTVALGLARDSLASENTAWILCGFDNLRFQTPVQTGKRVRCLTTLLSARERDAARLLRVQLKLEIEGEKIPAFTTKCSLLCTQITAES
jgi:acyl dehydratase